MIKKEHLLIIVLIIIPNFLHVFTGPYGKSFVILTYFIIFLSAALILKESRYYSKSVSEIFIINLLFMIIIFYQIIIGNTFNPDGLRRLIPFLLATVILLLLVGKDKKGNELIIDKIIFYIVVSFYLQLILSLYESLVGFQIVDTYNQYINTPYLTQTGYKNRFIFDISSVYNPFNYLKFGLTGLQGGHNNWALQLPIYNLIFAFAYVKSKKRVYLIALFFVFISQILNTTRTAIFVIFITDLFLFIKLYSKRNFLQKVFFTVLSCLILYFSASSIYSYVISYFARTDTYSIRYEIYNSAVNYLKYNYGDLILGTGPSEMGKVVASLLHTQGYNSNLATFENGFLDIVFLFGIFGLGLLIYLLKIFISASKKSTSSNFNKLLVFNILILNLTLSHIFQIHVYPFIIFFYMMLINSDI